MTAWQLLIAHSSLESGTAWEHLNAQVTGTGSGTSVVYSGDLKIMAVASELQLEPSSSELILTTKPAPIVSVVNGSVVCAITNNGVIVHV